MVRLGNLKFAHHGAVSYMLKRIVDLPLSRPRDPASPEFGRLQRDGTALVMAEEARHQADEVQARAG